MLFSIKVLLILLSNIKDFKKWFVIFQLMQLIKDYLLRKKKLIKIIKYQKLIVKDNVLLLCLLKIVILLIKEKILNYIMKLMKWKERLRKINNKISKNRNKMNSKI